MRVDKDYHDLLKQSMYVNSWSYDQTFTSAHRMTTKFSLWKIDKIYNCLLILGQVGHKTNNPF